MEQRQTIYTQIICCFSSGAVLFAIINVIFNTHGTGQIREELSRILEDLMVLKRSPDLLNNVKIGQDQLQLKLKHILFYGGCGHFGQVT